MLYKLPTSSHSSASYAADSGLYERESILQTAVVVIDNTDTEEAALTSNVSVGVTIKRD